MNWHFFSLPGIDPKWLMGTSVQVFVLPAVARPLPQSRFFLSVPSFFLPLAAWREGILEFLFENFDPFSPQLTISLVSL